MISLPKTIASFFTSDQQKPRTYLDASTFHPEKPCRGQAVILVAHNEARTIYERVCQARISSAVVVVDQGSTDGTSYFAAEAGAVVVLQEPGMSCEVVMQKAAEVARSLSQNNE